MNSKLKFLTISYVLYLLHENNLQDQAAHLVENTRLRKLRTKREKEREQLER